jgi:hypothetical protein
MEDRERRRAKQFLLFGTILGAIISVGISILMDVLLADTLQGTWRDAIAKDVNTFLHLGVTPHSIVVYVLFVVVLGILAAFGAFIGFIFSFFLYKFFSFLTSQ